MTIPPRTDDRKTRLLLPALLLFTSFAAIAADAPQEALKDFPPKESALAAWRDARFGMFIHWDPVSIKGTEIGWSRDREVPAAEYDSLYKQFNPVGFNADEWVAAAKAAGMKYLVFTAKHLDGFSMWDTRESDYNIMNSPFKRDVVKELAEACKKGGIGFGAYYCIADFYHPDFPISSAKGKAFRREKSDIEAYNRFLLAQITELVKNYGPLVTLWFDDPREFKGRGINIIKLARELQPDILVNNRTGDGGDYNTSEQRIGKSLNNRPWETCMTIGRQWSWKPNDEMKSLKDCLQTLVACAGGDGNLLFNVGPMPDGRIEPRQVERLKEMGAWLAKNGEAIYGTRGGPWKSTKAVASTRKGDEVFVHVLRRGENKVLLPDLPVEVKSAALLDGRDVKLARQDGNLTLELDPATLDPIDTIVRLKLGGKAMDIPWIALDPGIKGSASSVAEDPKFAAQFAFDSDSATRWMAAKDARQAWIAADFGKPITIERVRIMEDVEARAVEGVVGEGVGRVQKFELQYRNGDEWKTIFSGDKLGRWFQKKFEPVEAREFRLNILEATDSPGIADIEFIEH